MKYRIIDVIFFMSFSFKVKSYTGQVVVVFFVFCFFAVLVDIFLWINEAFWTTNRKKRTHEIYFLQIIRWTDK